MKPRALTSTLFIVLISVALSATASERIILNGNIVPVLYDLSVTPDAQALTFNGLVKITIEVKNPTRQIELNAIDLHFQRAVLNGMGSPQTIAFDTKQQTATLTFSAPISAGSHVLSITYTGRINQNAAGLFALDYETASGKQRALFTQFENADARRFLPCWDEPARKAVFALTVTVPADEMAVSNMPIADKKRLSHGLMRIQFQPSPKMSTYLLFFGLGDFERISRKVDGVDVGVIVKRGDTAKAQFALDAASKILPYYDDYFGVKYPLPKLDLIAGPGESQFFGAMENWGAIFFFERDLLIDPKISTQGDQRGIYITIAHEMSHQWFGDLVTMAWWDDLWLNEGFASWMELKATDHFHPEWNVWLGSLSGKEYTMQMDAREGTHPIIQPISDVLQANQAFDAITYIKGQAVIRMLEDYVGDDAFRAGVRNYIKAHAYGNAVTDDLWRELDKTASKPVTQVAHDFTLQAGVPLIRVTSIADGMHLAQDRFTEDDSGKVPTSWHVPVAEASPGSTTIWHGLVSRDMPVDVTLPSGVAHIVNAGQTGYYRTLYGPEAFAKIALQFDALEPADQLGILNDSRSLGFSGYIPLSDFLQLTSNTKPDMNPVVLRTVSARLRGINDLYEGLPGQEQFKAYGRRVLAPIFMGLGWTPKSGESQNETLLRNEVLYALAEFDDPKVITEAQQRFESYLKDPTSLSGDLRRNVLEIVSIHANAATWEQLHKLASSAKTSFEQNELYPLLGAVHDRKLAERALELSLSDEVPITVRPTIVDYVSIYYPDMAVDFVVAHSDTFNKLLEPDSRSQYVPELAMNSNDLSLIQKLRAYTAVHIPKDDRGNEIKAEASITFNAMTRTKRLPEVDQWLAMHQ